MTLTVRRSTWTGEERMRVISREEGGVSSEGGIATKRQRLQVSVEPRTAYLELSGQNEEESGEIWHDKSRGKQFRAMISITSQRASRGSSGEKNPLRR